MTVSLAQGGDGLGAMWGEQKARELLAEAGFTSVDVQAPRPRSVQRVLRGAPLTFTTRPELRGTFGMVASTHWLASQTGMAVLERGGNAFDAAVATGFVLQVVEPHLNGPGGEVPGGLLVGRARRAARALRAGRRSRGRDDRALPRARPRADPGDRRARRVRAGRVRRLAAPAPRVRHVAPRGRARVRDRLRGARLPAARADPRDDRARTEELLASWPGSRDLYLPAPEPGALFRNPALAATYRRIVEESRGGSREDEIEKRASRVLRGLRRGGDRPLLRGRGRAAHRATTWPPGRRRSSPSSRFDYRGLTVCKTQPWAAGPVGLQQLALLRGLRPRRALDGRARPCRRRVREARVRRSRRAVRRRRGRPARHAALGASTTTSAERSSARRPRRSTGPGIGAFRRVRAAEATPGSGEPGRGTVHLDIADRFGNLISATPSGGWLQSSPVIPALGWPLGTRAQMFWLEEGLRVVPAAGNAAAHDALSRARAPRRASRTSRGERPAATSRSSGRSTRSCATSISA